VRRVTYGYWSCLLPDAPVGPAALGMETVNARAREMGSAR